jgi:hypothetical protein
VKVLQNSTSNPLVYAQDSIKKFQETKNNEQWFIKMNLDESTKTMMTTNEPIQIYIISKLDLLVPSQDRPILTPHQKSVIPNEDEFFNQYLDVIQTAKLDLAAQLLSLVRNILILKKKHSLPYN